jgi:hypothetical protein
MASIRTFSSAGAYLRTSIGACNVGFGSLAAVIGNISARSVAGATCMIGLHNSEGKGKGLLLWTNESKLSFYNGTTVLNSGITVNTGEGDLFLAWTKATGTTKVKFYKYKYSTGEWTIEEPATTIANGGSVAGKRSAAKRR